MTSPPHAIKCLKADGWNSVWLVQPHGEKPRTLKTWPLGPWMLVKLLLGIAQPQRQVRGIKRLQRAGVNTPQCIRSTRIRMRQHRPLIELQLEFVPGCTAWELTSGQPCDHSNNPSALLRSARMVGRTVFKLASGGVFHRDLKLSNVVIGFADDANTPSVWVIDAVGVRRMRRRGVEIERMLERLAVEKMGLERQLATAIRTAVLRAALRPLPQHERREVLSRLRARSSGAA